MDAALASGRTDMDVPCGSCTACCRSSQFVLVTREEPETLRRIPDALLFPAPGRPEGDKVMGHDEHGCCPMLVDDVCSIYEHRPSTCRIYDCRVFAAAGTDGAEIGRPWIARRATRWAFTYPSERDRALASAVTAAANFLRTHPACFPGGAAHNAGEIATLAIRVHRLFAEAHDVYRSTGRPASDQEMVDAIRALQHTRRE
jgi:Fe-S-cluster containining protein